MQQLRSISEDKFYGKKDARWEARLLRLTSEASTSSSSRANVDDDDDGEDDDGRVTAMTLTLNNNNHKRRKEEKTTTTMMKTTNRREKCQVFPLQETAFEYGDRENEKLLRALNKTRRSELEDHSSEMASASSSSSKKEGPPWWMEDSLLRFFSFEKNANGKRKFVVATWEGILLLTHCCSH